MTLLFYLSAAVVLYTYAGYPLLLAALASLRPKPWKRGSVPGTASVILPVHDGMAMLPGKIAALTKVGSDSVSEIIIVCDGCTDGAPQWLATCTDSRIRSVVLPEQVGKATALRYGMTAAKADYLLFIDVRPDVTDVAIHALLSNFADPSVGCAAGELRIQPSTNGTSTTSAVGGLYWRYEQWMRNNEAAYDSPVGVYGGFYAIRRDLATLPPEGLILDDMFQPLSIIRRGYRSVVDLNAVVYDRWPATSKGEFARKVRTLAGNFQLIAAAPWLLNPAANRVWLQLMSHKLLRLVVPYCFVTMLLAAVSLALHSSAWTTVAGLQVLGWSIAFVALAVRLPIIGKAAGAASALALLNVAAVRALWVYMFTQGPLWKIWNATKAPAERPTQEVAG